MLPPAPDALPSPPWPRWPQPRWVARPSILGLVVPIALCLAIAAPAAASPDPAALRLPRSVLPLHYDLTLDPDLEAATFAGEVTIEVEVEVPVREIVLHAAELEVDSAVVEVGALRRVAAVAARPESETLSLTVDEPLPVGRARIVLRYRGLLNDDLRGFYLGHAEGRPYAASQLQSTDARRAFPCWDEPAFKATFDVRLVVDDGLVAFSNGPEISSRPGPGEGRRTVRFATTPRISTYLLAFVVGDFACLESRVGEVPLRVCAHPELVELGRYALEETERILPFLEEWFGVPFPFAKLDQIAVADFAAGAMENAGAILYRETELLLDPTSASLEQRQEVGAVLAHEIAHHWFGNLVTMEWWDDLWLSEGFASFMESRTLAALHPDADVATLDAAAAGWPLGLDALASTRAIRQTAQTPDEIEELFDGIAYGKASAVLRMALGWVGEAKLRAGLRELLVRNAFGTVTAEDFFVAFSRSSARPLDRTMRSFVDQPGVPLVRVAAHCEGDMTVVVLRQERFVAAPHRAAPAPGPGDAGGSAPGSSPGSATQAGTSESRRQEPRAQWTVPVCFRSGGCVLLDEAAATSRLAGCRTAPFANADGRGYYVTEAEPELLAALTATARELSAAERLTLLRDVEMLVAAERLPISRWLELARALAGERNPRVASQIIDHLESLDREVVRPEDRPAFEGFVRELFGPLAAELGWVPEPNEAEDVRQLRARVLWALGALGRDPAVLERATRLTETYLEDRAALPPSLVSTVVALAAPGAEPQLWEAFREAAETSPPEEAERFLFALGKVEDPRLLDRALQAVLAGEIRSQDALDLLGGLAERKIGGALVWSFVDEHWEALLARLPQRSHGWVLPLASRSFCSAEQRRALVEAAEARGVAGGERALAHRLEAIDRCERRHEAQANALGRWLEGRTRAAAAAPATAP